ncbi:MAG: hypothetical protein Q8O97_02075 [bacterium]|nr:hypothetical protein [Candidatus Wildermuthbacteria bacterium]MDP2664732.1 hypothetical protein [bacterium]
MPFSFPKAKTLVQQRQMQRLLTSAFLLVIGITAFILWQGFFKQAPTDVTVPNVGAPRQKVEINFDFFKSNVFEKFSLPLEEPVPPQNLGRQNPFVPF